MMRAGYMAEDANDLHDDTDDRPDPREPDQPTSDLDVTASRFWPGNPHQWGAA